MKTLHFFLLIFSIVFLFAPSYGQQVPLDGREGGIIAYTSFHHDEADIYLMNGDGSGKFKFIDSPALDFAPRWSPDGTSLLFSSDREGHFELYVVNIADLENRDWSQPIRITNNDFLEDFASWSPDGNRILFCATIDDQNGIFEIDLSGDDLTLIYSTDYDVFQPQWSPTGDDLLYVANINGRNQIFKFNPANGTSVQLTIDGGYVPRWSPDGNKIVYANEKYGHEDLFVMDADGHNVRRITTQGNHDFLPAWSPDGEWIVYQYSSAAGDDIHKMSLQGLGDVELSSSTSSDDTFPDWRPQSTSGTFTNLNRMGEKNLKLYPNPVRDQAHVLMNLTESEFAGVSILNVLGEKVADLQGSFVDWGSKRVSLNLHFLETGCYYIMLKKPGNISPVLPFIKL